MRPPLYSSARYRQLLWPLLTSHQFSRTGETSPGKSIFPVRPESAGRASPNHCRIYLISTLPCGLSDVTMMCLLIQLIKPHMRFLFACPVTKCIGVSTGVFPAAAGFLHCIPHGKPACHLLTVRGVTPARKGLLPREMRSNFCKAKIISRGEPSGNISCYTLPFNPKNLYFRHFFRAFSSVCTCSCWAHIE
jgi:hypothetical protein